MALGRLWLALEETARLSSKVAIIFCVPTISFSSTSSPAFDVVSVLDSNHTVGCVVVSYLNLQFSHGIWCWVPFHLFNLFSAYLLGWGIYSDRFCYLGNDGIRVCEEIFPFSGADCGETIWARAFCFGRLLIIDFKFLIEMTYWASLFFLVWNLVYCVFQVIHPFNLKL